MYPRDFFATYWRTEIREEVFVAMPFHHEFDPIWQDVIAPAIDDDIPDPIRARRVDSTVLSGSIVTDILDGIAHARIILADISVAAEGRWIGQRNGNVMYEVGLAHAVRQSTELCLIRADDEVINFDVAHINIHKYDRADLPAARKLVGSLVSDLLRNIELEKSLKVAQTIENLDADTVLYMEEFAIQGPFVGPNPKTMGEELVSISKRAALARLQQLGIVRSLGKPDGAQVVFDITPFGKTVATKMGLPQLSGRADR